MTLTSCSTALALIGAAASLAAAPGIAAPPATKASPAAAATPATSTSLPGFTAPAPLPTDTAPVLNTIQPVSGDISALYGRINPFYGDITSAYGRINPFYGRINPFYGRINPFFGDVSGFWGRINPFTQTTDAATTAFYGTAFDPFWGKTTPYKDIGPGVKYGDLSGFWANEFSAWTTILPMWNSAATAPDANTVAAAIQTSLLAPATKFWAPVLSNPAKGSSGGPGNPAPAATTTQALLQAQLAAAGVTFNADGSVNSASLLNGDPTARAMLFLNVYDALMDYAGTGHVDWWMAQVGWTPALAATQGAPLSADRTPTIGMIDFALSVTADSKGKGKPGPHISQQVVQYGSTVFADGHGAAVGSLIIGATDGSGVLGVLPSGAGKVVVYDPYDGSNTTNWTDVGTGVATLTKTIGGLQSSPMGVLNASLGVPGWTLNPGWNDALKGAGAHGLDLVIAAGNDGSTQTANVPWDVANNPTLIIVGSVGPDGTISNFSNRPGEACLLPDSSTTCTEANKLKYRFIVAPGELILVSDGLGGHMRQSGTSLAAPLVSGAIALLQNRWPWLAKYPTETASIILKSATPLGSQPGADPVYGVGELNIAASQSPLDWSSLVYYQNNDGKPNPTPLTLSTVVSQIASGTQSSWNASGLWFSAFEKIGNTYRDFQIPLAAKLVGQNVATAAGGQSYQSFLAATLRAQAGHFAGGGFTDAGLTPLQNGFARSTAPAGDFGGASLRVRIAPSDLGNAFDTRRSLYNADALVATEGATFQFGYGEGASALDGSAGFGFHSDYDLGRGGANPLLGLASGGAYLGGRATVAQGLTVAFGTTQRASRRNLLAFGIDQSRAGDWIDRYAADAQNVAVAYAFGSRLQVRANFTRLSEDAALLGTQSLDPADFAKGARTDGTTLAFDWSPARGWLVSGTTTMARTRSDGGQIGTHGLTSGSAAVALARTHLLAHDDEVRLTLASPLHTVAGRVTYTGIGVVDRATGEIGEVTQSLAPRSRMPLAYQASYGIALPRHAGEFSLFGRVDKADALTATGATGYSGGAQFGLRF